MATLATVSIDDAYIESAAPNAAAAKNGRGLVLKRKFTSLHRAADDSLLFGYCAGSGKTPYLCSADFAVPSAPVFRCTCPSRQFPCKHALGLLYAFADENSFSVADVPEELSSKREKAAARSEKKKAAADAPRTVNKSALAKKIKAQLDGIDLLEKLTRDLVRLGIGNMNAKSARELEEQAKQLGNAYLPGAQAALGNYTKLFYNIDGDELSAAARESVYSEALDQLSRLHALIGKGRAYLQGRLADPELAPETDTPIAAWLGHAWQLRELKDVGLVQENIELIQLAFNSYDDVARKEFVDTGLWMNLSTGQIQLTQNFRPYKAVKYIKSDDSFFQIAQIEQLYVYPGDINPRIRWEAHLARAIAPTDLKRVRQHAHQNFAEVIKTVKSTLKAPLADKHPVFALNFKRIGQVDTQYVVEDAQGDRLVMTDQGMYEEPRSAHLISLLPPTLLENQTMLVRFRHDLDSRKLQIKPLSIVTNDEVIRLTY
ncbi:MAG: SWIM zinc finger family protein [Pirellulaceae bacterium]